LSALCLALLLVAAAGPESAGPGARQARFLELLRTYPSRPSTESVALVTALIDEGPFAERDRALFWLGSVRLNALDLPSARAFFARLRREHPGSPWLERADLGEADACAVERDYGAALEWLQRASAASDPAVRELARLSTAQLQALRVQQRWTYAAGAFAILIVGLWLVALWRRRPLPLWPLPDEARVLLPVLGVLAVLSLRIDPAPRAAVLQLCAAGALLVILSGLYRRAANPGRALRALQTASTVLALGACFWVAIYRHDLVNMVLETFRAGPE
jgi:hypothetical protein